MTTDDLQAKIDRWRATAELDTRTGVPVSDALLDACNELERLRGELAEYVVIGDEATVSANTKIARLERRAEQAEAEAKRLQRIVDDLRDGLENRRLRNRNRRLEWILEYGRKQIERIVDRMVAAEAEVERLREVLARREERPVTGLQQEIEHARKKLAEYEASPATSHYRCSDDNVFVRYGYLTRLLEMLVEAYDAERATRKGA